MSTQVYPGDLRIGVLNEPLANLTQPTERQLTPKQMFMLLLNGHQKFSIDGREFLLSTEQQNGPVAMMVRLEQNATLRILEQRGQPFSKISISVAPHWPGIPSRESGFSMGLLGHLSHHELQVDASLLGPASSLIRETPRRNILDELAFMSQGLNLYRAGLSACTHGHDNNARPGVEAALARIRQQTAQELNDPHFTAQRLADACALSARTLQRLCQKHFGQSPGDYIRHQRLARAFSALQERKVTVEQAADIAGYSSAANFSTAFKRRYGFPPRTVQAQSRLGAAASEAG